MVVEIAAAVVAVVFAVLVGYLVPTLLEVKKTVAETRQLLAQMNQELPSVLSDLRRMAENINELADRTKGGLEHASVFLHAVGDIGDTLQQVSGALRFRSGGLLANMASVVAGIRAASAVVKERVRKEGGQNNGG
jgi:uncharacterized protein YoxC